MYIIFKFSLSSSFQQEKLKNRGFWEIFLKDGEFPTIYHTMIQMLGIIFVTC